MPFKSAPSCRVFAVAMSLFIAVPAAAQSALEPEDTASLDQIVLAVATESVPTHPLLNEAKLAAIAPPVKRSAWGKLHPHVRRTLSEVERKFGRPVMVTSGCRSRRANRLAGGARRSLHLDCMAADFKVAGVSKTSLVKFVRTLPGRGGVGTYCRNSIVHVDAGPVRDWHQRCR